MKMCTKFRFGALNIIPVTSRLLFDSSDLSRRASFTVVLRNHFKISSWRGLFHIAVDAVENGRKR